MANVGHAQTRKDNVQEPPLVTVGDDLNTIATFLAPGRESYSAADVVKSLLSLSEVTEESAESVLAMAPMSVAPPIQTMEPILATA